MKITIIGAGRIGRGYTSSLLLLNNCEITFFDQKEIIDVLNEVKSYEIHVLGNESNNIIHDNYHAYCMGDIEKLVECIKESKFIFTAVGGKHMIDIGVNLGQAYKKIINENKISIQNIVTCENWINPAKDLKETILKQLSNDEQAVFNEYVGVSESIIVATGTGCPDQEGPKNPMDTWIQNIRYLPIDKDRLKGEIPNWQYFVFKENFGNLLTQKLYTNNTSCTAMSYIGLLCGEKILCETCNRKDLRPILDELYVEINSALIDGMGIEKESQLEFSRHALEKYTDRNIIDPLTRIARDPIRKLKPEDRFIKPGRLAFKAGTKPWAIAMGAAAALFYEDDDDDSAGELKKLREEKGISYILENICCLDKDEPMYSLIIEEVEDLRRRGWLKSES